MIDRAHILYSSLLHGAYIDDTAVHYNAYELHLKNNIYNYIEEISTNTISNCGYPTCYLILICRIFKFKIVVIQPLCGSEDIFFI